MDRGTKGKEKIEGKVINQCWEWNFFSKENGGKRIQGSWL